ncbi:MAG: acyltransferase [Lachnospiraceae bacterium]|nr:acyltransferase [Lachnospiraceae bacterium]
MKKLGRIIRELIRISIFKTLYYNYFSSRVSRKNGGIIIIYKGASLYIEKGSKIIIDGGKFMYGYSYKNAISYKAPSIIRILDKSNLIVKGKFIVEYNCDILVKDGATMEVGADSYFNCNTFVRCHKSIIIGEEFLGANNLSIRDNDGHKLNGIYKATPVVIGKHVWCGMNVSIMKGVNIGEGVVIGANALITRDIPDACLAYGMPAEVHKQNIKWER